MNLKENLKYFCPILSKNIKAITLATILLLNLPLFGQMVGVKEKNSFYLGYRGAISVGLVNQLSGQPRSSTTQEKDSKLHFNSYPRLDYNFALTNRFSVQAHFSAAKVSRYNSTNYYAWYDGVELPWYQYEIGRPKYSDLKYGVQFNYFFKRLASIAPVGTYVGVGFSQRTTKGSHQAMQLMTNHHYNGRSVDPILDLSGYDIKMNNIRMNFQVGTRELIGERLYYDYTIDLGFTVHNSLYTNTSIYEIPETLEEGIKDMLEDRMDDSYKFRDVFTFNLGLGYILH